MSVTSEKNRLDFVEHSSSGLPEGRRIPDGSTCHFVDTGDRYISLNENWTRDMRYPVPAEGAV